MFKTITRIVGIILIILGLLWFANTTHKKFAQDIELKNPLDVFHITLPGYEEVDPYANMDTLDLPHISVVKPNINIKTPNLPAFDLNASGVNSIDP